MGKIMQNKESFRAFIENLLGVQIYRASHHGHHDCTDIKRSGCQISTVFDVGANIGQSALKYRAAFPEAKIYSFEPVKKTYERLKENVKKYNAISCHNIALGGCNGQEKIYLTGQSVTSSFIKSDKVVGEEVVQVCTVDTFVLENQIRRIDLLKIDAEGFDLEVLKGAENMLCFGQIPFVLAEISFHPGDASHVLFDDIRSYLAPMGYEVFGIYDQQLEWSGEKRLRFANVCFSKESAFTYHN
jgi:FkbM family methyltransferase